MVKVMMDPAMPNAARKAKIADGRRRSPAPRDTCGPIAVLSAAGLACAIGGKDDAAAELAPALDFAGDDTEEVVFWSGFGAVL